MSMGKFTADHYICMPPLPVQRVYRGRFGRLRALAVRDEFERRKADQLRATIMVQRKCVNLYI